MNPYTSQDRQITTGLRALPRVEAPAELSARLRVLGSREALRRRRSASPAAFWAYCRETFALWTENLVRPLAMPAAGGLASAIFLFAVISPALTVNRPVQSDVPTSLLTAASLESSFSFSPVGVDLIVVDVIVDEMGKVVDYSIPEGQNWAKNPMMVRGLESTLLYTKFTPATFFGQPSAGKTRITLRRSQVEVRG